MKIQVNTEAFVQGMQAAQAEIADRIRQAIQISCIEIEGAAKEKCPKGSGMGGETVPLRQSISHKVVASEGGRALGMVGSPLEYAVYVHEGTGLYSRTGMGRKDVPWTYRSSAGDFYSTKGNRPQPFLEEAADEKRERVRQIFSAILGGGK